MACAQPPCCDKLRDANTFLSRAIEDANRQLENFNVIHPDRLECTLSKTEKCDKSVLMIKCRDLNNLLSCLEKLIGKHINEHSEILRGHSGRRSGQVGLADSGISLSSKELQSMPDEEIQRLNEQFQTNVKTLENVLISENTDK